MRNSTMKDVIMAVKKHCPIIEYNTGKRLKITGIANLGFDTVIGVTVSNGAFDVLCMAHFESGRIYVFTKDKIGILCNIGVDEIFRYNSIAESSYQIKAFYANDQVIYTRLKRLPYRYKAAFSEMGLTDNLEILQQQYEQDNNICKFYAHIHNIYSRIYGDRLSDSFIDDMNGYETERRCEFMRHLQDIIFRDKYGVDEHGEEKKVVGIIDYGPGWPISIMVKDDNSTAISITDVNIHDDTMYIGKEITELNSISLNSIKRFNENNFRKIKTVYSQEGCILVK